MSGPLSIPTPDKRFKHVIPKTRIYDAGDGCQHGSAERVRCASGADRLATHSWPPQTLNRGLPQPLLPGAPGVSASRSRGMRCTMTSCAPSHANSVPCAVRSWLRAPQIQRPAAFKRPSVRRRANGWCRTHLRGAWVRPLYAARGPYLWAVSLGCFMESSARGAHAGRGCGRARIRKTRLARLAQIQAKRT